MNSLKIGSWLQLGANVGILVGLVFVYAQIRQNNEILRIEMLQSDSQSAIQMEQSLIGEHGARAWAKAMTEPKNLTLEEQRILEAILWSNVENWRHAYQLAESQLIGDEWKTRVDTDAPYFLGSPYGRAWWRVFGTSENLPETLRDYISSVLANQQETSNFPVYYHAQMMSALEAESAPERALEQQ